MVVKVTPKDRESTEKLLKRFSGHVKSLRLMQKFRSLRYARQTPRKWQVRDAAIMREQHRAENKKKQYLG